MAVARAARAAIERPTLAGTGDDDAHQCLSSRRRAGRGRPRRSCDVVLARAATCTRSPSWTTVSRSGSMPVAEPGEEGDPAPAAVLEVGDPAADPRRVDVHLGEPDRARWGRVHSGSAPCGQQPAQHLVGGPAHGRDGRDAEPLVDLGAAGVVDAGDDVARRRRSRGRPARRGCWSCRRCETAAKASASARSRPRSRTSRSKPTPVTVSPVEARAAAAGRPSASLVDDRDRVARSLEAAGQRRADAAASHDHDVHGRALPTSRAAPAAPVRRALPLAPRGQPGGPVQAPARRPRHAQRPAGRDAPAQAHRAAGLRQRRAVVGGLRDPDEILIILSLAGAAGCTPAPWVGIAVVVVMLDRRRRRTGRTCTPTPAAAATTRSPPPTSGRRPALIVASALLVDYVLTVAVSISSGVREPRLGAPRSAGWRARGARSLSVVAIIAAA